MSRYNNEKILVVLTSKFVSLGYFQGFEPDYQKYLEALLNGAHFIPRGEAETNPTYKQLIPYTILRHADLVFAYKRGKKSTEERLRSLWSIGIGGHINDRCMQGESMWGVLADSMWRELYEEVDIQCGGNPSITGLINDDSNDVGRVHLGIVMQLLLEKPQVEAREDGISESRFMTITEAHNLKDQFETWSQLCLDAIYKPDVQQ